MCFKKCVLRIWLEDVWERHAPNFPFHRVIFIIYDLKSGKTDKIVVSILHSINTHRTELQISSLFFCYQSTSKLSSCVRPLCGAWKCNESKHHSKLKWTITYRVPSHTKYISCISLDICGQPIKPKICWNTTIYRRKNEPNRRARRRVMAATRPPTVSNITSICTISSEPQRIFREKRSTVSTK